MISTSLLTRLNLSTAFCSHCLRWSPVKILVLWVLHARAVPQLPVEQRHDMRCLLHVLIVNP